MIIGNETGKQNNRIIVNAPLINNLSKNVNILRKLDFDQKQFRTLQNQSGIHVSLREQVETPEEIQNHFQIEAGNTASTFVVHGGNWIRRIDIQDFVLSLAGGVYSGTDLISANDGDYIVLELRTDAGNGLRPTVLSVIASDTWPEAIQTTSGIIYDYLVLGRVNSASNGTFEQYFDGDYKDYYSINDGDRANLGVHKYKSLDTNTDDSKQIYNFQEAEYIQPSCDDDISFLIREKNPDATIEIKYVGKGEFENWLNACVEILYATNSGTADSVDPGFFDNSWANVVGGGLLSGVIWHPLLDKLNVSDDHEHYFADDHFRGRCIDFPTNHNEDSYFTTGTIGGGKLFIENCLSNFINSDYWNDTGIHLETQGLDIDTTALVSIKSSSAIIIGELGGGFVNIASGFNITMTTDQDVVINPTNSANVTAQTYSLTTATTSSISIGTDQTETIGNDYNLTVTNDYNLTVNGGLTIDTQTDALGAYWNHNSIYMIKTGGYPQVVIGGTTSLLVDKDGSTIVDLGGSGNAGYFTTAAGNTEIENATYSIDSTRRIHSDEGFAANGNLGQTSNVFNLVLADGTLVPVNFIGGILVV